MVNGLHHVTAFAGNAQQNVDFYTVVLGLRLVKKTVNFDDHGTYHFYFGDASGSPGTLMTTFPWSEHGRPGRAGTGQVVATAFDVPAGSLEFWKRRITESGLEAHGPAERFDESVLLVTDPDGMELELTARDDVGEVDAWSRSGVPEDYAIRRIGGVTLLLRETGGTSELVTGLLGFEHQGDEAARSRFRSGPTRVDLVAAPDRDRGEMGVGAVHHVAWRVPNDAAQLDALGRLRENGLRVTDVQDRQYFHSIYFREPGGVLFEIATDPPGFGIDEESDALGTELKLPPWLEKDRHAIESKLPSVSLRV